MCNNTFIIRHLRYFKLPTQEIAEWLDITPSVVRKQLVNPTGGFSQTEFTDVLTPLVYFGRREAGHKISFRVAAEISRSVLTFLRCSGLVPSNDQICRAYVNARTSGSKQKESIRNRMANYISAGELDRNPQLRSIAQMFNAVVIGDHPVRFAIRTRFRFALRLFEWLNRITGGRPSAFPLALLQDAIQKHAYPVRVMSHFEQVGIPEMPSARAIAA